MEFEGLVFKRMLDEVNKSRNATETLFDVMSAYNFDDGVKLNNLKTIMYDLCNHINNEIFYGIFKNPYNVSLYVTNLILLNYDTIYEELNDGDSYYGDFYIIDKIKPFKKIFQEKIGPTTDIGKKFYEEEGMDINAISEIIEEKLSIEDEEDILELLFLDVKDTTSRYLADKYAEKIVAAIKEIDKIAREFIKDGLSKEEILLSSLVVFTIVEDLMDGLISGLTETENTYRDYGEKYVNKDNPLLTKANCNVALGWLESLENDDEDYKYSNGIGYCRDLLENILFYMNNAREVTDDDAYGKNDDYKMNKFKIYRDAIIKSVEGHAGFLCDMQIGVFNAFTTSLSIYVDIFRHIYL